MNDAARALPAKDVSLVRALAAQVVELATSEEYERRRQRWREVTERRQPDRAPMWCRPAGVWREIIPQDALECTDPLCRQTEYAFRRDLYKDWVGDDHIVEPWWPIRAAFSCSSEHTWGLETHRSIGTTEQGGFRYYHPVQTPDDYEKITIPEFSYDREATERTASQMQNLLGEVMPVRIPSLAERPEDIPILFRRYVDQAAEQSGLAVPPISPQVIAGLMARDWPGNARALMSAAMRFVMGVADDVAPDADLGLAEQMAQVEQSLLRAALKRAGGQASAAASALKLPRKTFYDKLTRYGIRAEDYRS